MNGEIIAVLSESFAMFHDFTYNMEPEFKRKFRRVSKIQDVMGLEFSDYIVLGDKWKIDNSAVLIAEINARIR